MKTLEVSSFLTDFTPYLLHAQSKISQTRREAHSLYVCILSFHWHKL